MVRRTTGAGAGGAGRGRAGARVRAARRPEVRLPRLRAHDGRPLAPDGDFDSLEFDGADFTGQDGAGARFLDCALRTCVLDDVSLRGARVLDSVLTDVRGVGCDLAETTWRDAELAGFRLGGVQLYGAVLERVHIRGGKIDYGNLRAARLRDVVFENCVLVEPDFSGARLERVEFTDCALTGVDFGAATLRDVDLRGAAPLRIARGADRLSGAVIGTAQLLDLAPVLAAELGITVAD
ncbi:pentapeptide repeat-containing protein [Streptomyces thermoviolaceus]|uniref:Pentapeptide repeat-containing protein n=1 Tax=Streptomyces thermoviolaceus subsp. thermoviolaceus TaxID=66860 RepID=A0ABX0YSB2_STRTL|nr:pentapeptide repeat-containing protein [Streptomyces thermoviolaceus]NJP15460.1 pentapeptide repeat-containing protein [Streptomyces thermoviolaceus subsp. thermoviolaceus]